MPKKKWCPTGAKVKYFNEAWALMAKAETEVRSGANLRVYKCPCGWWHLRDKSKARKKDNARESRNVRRRRSKQARKN